MPDRTVRWAVLCCFMTLGPAACRPEPGADTASIDQCPGNHPDSSLALWLQAAQQDLNLPGATVTAHPSNNCIIIAVGDTARFPEAQAALSRLRIPRDAVVLTAQP